MTPNPQDSAVALEVERAAFEADYLRRFNAPGYLGRTQTGNYGHLITQARWESWQARASQPDGTSGGVKACLFAQTAELMRAIDAYAYDYREFGKLAPSRHTVQIAVYDALNKFQGENHVG